MKRCSKCKAQKPERDFYALPSEVSKKNPRGLTASCKDCRNKSNKIWREANRERVLANSARWKRDNVDKVQAQELKRQREKPDQLRNSNLKYNFGITLKDFRELEAAQRGRCAVCKEPSDATLCVDHDHKTGKIRGLLCRKCNAGIGQLNESSARLLKAAEYLKKHE